MLACSDHASRIRVAEIIEGRVGARHLLMALEKCSDWSSVGIVSTIAFHYWILV
jgi:hypothetical protein